RKYEPLFGTTVNLRILEYLTLCSKLDSTPYYSEYALIHQLDADSFSEGTLKLSETQFAQIVQQFQRDAAQEEKQRVQMQELGMNLLSVNTERGLYLLAYRPLFLDIVGRCLRARNEPVVCR